MGLFIYEIENMYRVSSLRISLLAFYHECRSLIGYYTSYLFCFSINLLAFYHEGRSLIGYAAHYLFCDR